MEWAIPLIDQLGGGVSAVALVGLALMYYLERQETKELYKRFLTVIEENTKAFVGLSSKIEELLRKD